MKKASPVPQAVREEMDDLATSLSADSLTYLYEEYLNEFIIQPKILHLGGNLLLASPRNFGSAEYMIDMLLEASGFPLPHSNLSISRPLRCYYLSQRGKYGDLSKAFLGAPDISGFPEGGDIHIKWGRCLPARFLAESLHESNVDKVAKDINECYPDEDKKVDIIAIDGFDLLLDGGEHGSDINDDQAIRYFLNERLESLRTNTNPAAAIILNYTFDGELDRTKLSDDCQPVGAFKCSPVLLDWYNTHIILCDPFNKDTKCLGMFRAYRAGPLVTKAAGQRFAIDEEPFEEGYFFSPRHY